MGTVAAGFYLYDPGIFGSGTAADSEREKIFGVTAADQNNSNGLPVNAAARNSAPPEETAGSLQAGETKTVAEDPKIADAAKTVKNPTADKKQKSAVADSETDRETVYVGNAKINNGRVETPNSIIDENRVRPKGPLPPNLRGLTLEQRRQMRIRRQNNQLNFPRPRPRY